MTIGVFIASVGTTHGDGLAIGSCGFAIVTVIRGGIGGRISFVRGNGLGTLALGLLRGTTTLALGASRVIGGCFGLCALYYLTFWSFVSFVPRVSFYRGGGFGMGVFSNVLALNRGAFGGPFA